MGGKTRSSIRAALLSMSSRDLATPREGGNADVTRHRLRNHEGVLLDYGDPGALRDYHREHKPQANDRERVELLKAERELLTLRVIVDHLDISNIGITRIHDALQQIQRALAAKRPRLGMSPPADEDAQ
jgi:hypothetical protein